MSELLAALDGNEVLRGYFVVFAGGVLAIPAALIGQCLKFISVKMPSAMPPERIPLMMMGLGGLGGWLLAEWLGIPQSIGIEIGSIAGGGSAVAYRNRGLLNGRKKGDTR